MKTKHFQSLMLVAVMILGLASCTGDNFDNPAPQNALGEEIVGLWYNKTDTEGALPDDMNWDFLGDGVDRVHYNRIIRSLLLRADGTGYACAMWFNNEQSEPIYMMGGLDAQGLSSLTYTTTADGRIILSFDQDNTLDECAEYFGQWSLRYADGTVSGSDGEATFQMELADNTMTGWLNDMYHRASGGAEPIVYNINDADFTPDNWRNVNALYINDGSVKLTSSNMKDPNNYQIVPLPWYKGEASLTTNLPVGFCDNITPENGWYLVFNCCGSTGLVNNNYFGLYNKWTGILRVFYYQPRITSTGSDHMWQVSITDELAQHALWGYGLPSTQTVKDKTKICNDQGGTISDYVTPYTASMKDDGSIEPHEGWWAFDVDLSLYRPDAIDFNNNSIKFQMRSWTTQHVSLWSTMTASIDGEFKQKVKEQKGWSGASIAKGVLLGAQAGFLGLSSWKAFVSDQPMGSSTGLGAIASILGCGGSFAGLFGGSPQPLEATISLSMDGTIDTQGTIDASAISVGITAPTIFLSSFKRDKVPSFGQGVWNLKKSPEVVVCRHGFVMDRKWANFPYVFDPSTIEVELNPNIFPESEIEWMQVDAHCVVTSKTGVTGTDKYREAFGFPSRFLGVGNNFMPGGRWQDTDLSKMSYDKFIKEPAPVIYDYTIYADGNTDMEWPLTLVEDKENRIVGRGYKDKFAIEPALLYTFEYETGVGTGNDELYFGLINKYVPGLEVNVVVQVKMKNMEAPIIYSRNYLPQFVSRNLYDANTIKAVKDHQLSPLQEGHRATYDYQVKRFEKVIMEMKARAGKY